MSEYPERIWAAEDRQTHSTMWWPDDAGGVGVEYVRADRIEDVQAEVNGAHEIILSERAEVLRLRERIKELEAKLAKAVEKLEDMQKVPRSDASHGILMVMIKHTLADLKGQDDG